MSRGEAVLATFHEFRDGLFASDVQALDRILDGAYRGYNLAGGLEGREVVLGAYAPDSGISLDTFEVDELRIDVMGEVGIVTGRGYIAGSSQDVPWEHHLRFCDVYVDRAGDWKLFLSHATPMEPATD